MGCHLSL
uniref:Uncharacterized protein n=3 Tax=Oryza TaxID=4527 RepID=A0A1Y8Z8E9_ORYRU